MRKVQTGTRIIYIPENDIFEFWFVYGLTEIKVGEIAKEAVASSNACHNFATAMARIAADDIYAYVRCELEKQREALKHA
jgi:hypothetical protein